MTGPTRRDLERRIDRLTSGEGSVTSIGTLTLPSWAVEELADYEPGEDMNADLAAAIRRADLERVGADR